MYCSCTGICQIRQILLEIRPEPDLAGFPKNGRIPDLPEPEQKSGTAYTHCSVLTAALTVHFCLTQIHGCIEQVIVTPTVQLTRRLNRLVRRERSARIAPVVVSVVVGGVVVLQGLLVGLVSETATETVAAAVSLKTAAHRYYKCNYLQRGLKPEVNDENNYFLHRCDVCVIIEPLILDLLTYLLTYLLT